MQKQQTNSTFNADVYIYLTVIIILGMIALTVVIGAIILASIGGVMPPILVSIGSTAIGALTPMLATLRINRRIRNL